MAVQLKTEPFAPGDTARIFADFVDAAGAPATPSAAALTIQRGATVVVTGALADFANPSTGRLEYPYLIPAAGHYYWRIDATLSQGHVIEDGSFDALAHAVYAQRRPRSLCTLGEVKRLIPRYTEPADERDREKADMLLLDLIAAASKRYRDVSGREFVSELDLGDTSDQGGTVWPDAPSETRTFDTILNPQTPGGGHAASILVGDMTAVTALTYAPRWPTNATPAALDLATYAILEPRDRGPWKPIRRLRILGGIYEGTVFNVTGRWGFPSIPDDVRMAVAEQASIWAGRDLSTFSQTFMQAVAAGGFPRTPRQLDQSVYDSAFSYRIESV